MRNLKLIIAREYLAKVRNRTFVVMTFLSPLIFAGMVTLIAYLGALSAEGSKVIAVHSSGDFFVDLLEDSNEVRFVDYSDLPLQEAKDSTKAKNYDALLYIPPDIEVNNPGTYEGKIIYFSQKSPDNSLLNKLETEISTEITNERLISSGINLDKLASAKTDIFIKIEDFSGQRSSKMALYIKMFFGGAAGYLLMMFIIIYGNMVLRSVIEEKTNRIVEIIISSVKPVQLMLGKIIGTTLAGITQFLIWVVLGGILMLVVPALLGIDISQIQTMQPTAQSAVQDAELRQLILDISHLPLLELVVYFLIYFTGGYFLYSSIYAAIGGAVDNETDTQQFMFPIILPLMLGIYVGFVAVINNPHGAVSTIFSMIPLTSPIVMLMRIPFGVPWWEIAISILILILTIVVTVWMAAKIYRIGILMYGKKPTYKELYKWLRY